jgi:HEPN domain-containing protein
MNVDPLQEWIQKAEEDWEAVRRLLDSGTPEAVADVVVFLCQQVAEKYLKAILVETGQEPPHTHNLGVLLDLATGSIPKLEAIRDDTEALGPFAVVFRYPGEWATEAEARQAVAMARRIRDALRDYLKL